jgi:C1A family cysteine protease
MNRKYAWKPDVPDYRDHMLSLAVVPAALPDHVDIVGKGVSIDDQGQLGSCTGNSTTAALEIVIKAAKVYSRLFAYYNGRALEGTTASDSGAQIRDVIKGLSSLGCPFESAWPYDISKFAKKPSATAYKTALNVVPKISSYQRVTDLPGVKTALAAGLPVVFGFSVPAYFESQDVATNGWVRMPMQSDQMIGGHAVVAVGYDDRPTEISGQPKPFVIVRNSWGASWGKSGYFYMDQAWFTDPRGLVDDMWVIHPKA